MEIVFWLFNFLFTFSRTHFIADIFYGKWDQNDAEGEVVLPFYMNDL